MIPVPNWSQTATLFPFDLRLTLRLRHVRFLLAGYGVAWLLLPLLAWQEALSWVQHPQGLGVLFDVMDSPGSPPLLFSHPPTLAILYLMGLTLTPAWVMVAACDQTTSSIRNHFFRFLLPHCGRATLYLSRFMVMGLLVIAIQLLVAACATAASLLLGEGPVGHTLLFGFRAGLLLSLHALALAAMMALISAWADTPRTALFTAILYYGGVSWLVSVLVPAWPAAGLALYLIPGGATAWLIRPEFSLTLIGSGVDLLYALLALWAGWWVFRSRAL